MVEQRAWLLPYSPLFNNNKVELDIMATKIVVGRSNVSAFQLSDFFRQIGDGSLNGIHLQALLEHRNPFDLDSVVIDWVKVYALLGMEIQFSYALADFNYWVVPVFKGVTHSKVVKALRGLGVKVSLYTNDLDKSVPTNDRDPVNGDYVVRFHKIIEADPELKNKSANDLTQMKVKGISLLERLLLELGYFLTTGNHLDVENITLCSGSRDSDCRVPSVRWGAGYRKVSVLWDRASDSDPHLRSRAVVS